MKISVIIPVYNTPLKLFDALTKQLSELNDCFEIIVIDDFSTSELSEQYKIICGQKNFLYLKNDRNRGVSFCRNRGITVSTGKFITFVDADDLINIKLYNSFSFQNQETDIYMMQYKCFKKDLEIKDIPFSCLKTANITIDNLSSDTIYNNFSIRTVWGKFYKKALICSNNILFNEKLPLSEDTLFSLQTIQKAKSIEVIKDEIGYFWRLAEKSASRKYRKNYNQIYNLFYSECIKLIYEPKLIRLVNIDTIGIYSITRTCMSFKRLKICNGLNFLKLDCVKIAALDLLPIFDSKSTIYKIGKKIINKKYLNCYFYIIKNRIKQKIFK